MLFYLTESLLVEKEDPEYLKVREAVRNLACSALQGKHLVLAGIKALTVFEDWFSGDDYVRVFFQRLIENYATIGPPKGLSYHIDIVRGALMSPNQMDYSLFLNFDALSQCALIAENDYDCQFYRFILSWYIGIFHSEENIRTVFSDVSGSGGETPSVIKKELKKNRVSVCIVDTDVRFPGDSPTKDSTCMKCRKVNKMLPYYKYLELSVHEIENLIPINFLLQTDGWHGDALAKKQAFEKICHDTRIMPYFDIKKGLFRSSKKDDALYVFGKMCYECNPSYTSERSYEAKYESMEPQIYPPLIENALKKTIQLLSSGRMEGEPQLLDF